MTICSDGCRKVRRPKVGDVCISVVLYRVSQF